MTDENGDDSSDPEAVVDDAALDAATVGTFSISSYGADYTVDGLVKRMKSKAFYVPDFQRDFVWTQKQSSRFIESLLLGLPVPGIFVFKEPETGRHLIIDGQQRLKSLEFYYEGLFGEKKFKLTDVREPWNDKSYSDLEEESKFRLDDSIIHTTIFQQDDPKDDKSIYEVFERINTGGIKLSAQEIRACVSYGPFNELIRQLDQNLEWRSLYGAPSKRLKDQELILRFFAFYFDFESYQRPFKSFLDSFLKKNRALQIHSADELTRLFSSTVNLAVGALGQKCFRPQRALNTAVFDSCMIGLARRLEAGTPSNDAIAVAYAGLLNNSTYMDACVRSTADETQVTTRMKIASAAFGNV